MDRKRTPSSWRYTTNLTKEAKFKCRPNLSGLPGQAGFGFGDSYDECQMNRD